MDGTTWIPPTRTSGGGGPARFFCPPDYTCVVRVGLAIVAGVAVLSGTVDSAPSRSLADLVTTLARDSTWNPVASMPMGFKTHHPQGLVRIGDTFVISSVEVRSPTRRIAPAGGHDRDTGEGVGHLFKADSRGKLIADLTLGEGTIYHPGGIDFDGTHVWVPVAEYRPDSRSIVYRVDPRTMRVQEVFRVPDHIGAIVHNTDDGTLHGVSWGSRRFYRWTLDRDGRVPGPGGTTEALRTLNPSHYVDYQDCKYAGRRQMLCTGIAGLRLSPEAPPFWLGGIDLVSLDDGRPVHQAPLLLWTGGGLSMARNAVWLEPGAAGVRGYFMPEDDNSTVYVYETKTSRAGQSTRP